MCTAILLMLRVGGAEGEATRTWNENCTIFILSQQDTPGNTDMIAIPFIYLQLYGRGASLYTTLGTYQKRGSRARPPHRCVHRVSL